MVININRNYVIKVDVKSGKVTTPKINFKNVDKSTSNIYVQLVIKETPYKSPVLVEEIENLAVLATIIKPNKAYKTVQAVLVDTIEGRLFELNLPDDCINLSGTCKVELTITGSVNGNIEQTTADVFTYTVEKSLQNELDPSIQDNEDLPVLKQLIEDIESAGGYKPKVNVNGSIIDSVEGVVKIPDYNTKAETQAVINEVGDARVDADGTTHTKLGDRLNKVDSQIKDKASNQELEVVKARINSLATLTEGSTTGDAELIDARVGADGVTYSNAGDAIRSQNLYRKNSSELKFELSGLIKKTLDVDWQLGKYRLDDGQAIENASMNRTFRFDVNGIVELEITNPSDYTFYHYFLYDSKSNFISSGDITYPFIIKHNGKIALDTAKTGYPAMTDSIEETKTNFNIYSYEKEDFDFLENVENLEKVEVTWEQSKAFYNINTSEFSPGDKGNFSTTSACEITVKENEIYYLKTITDASSLMNVVLFNANGVLLKSMVGGGITEEKIIIPKNCVKLGITCLTNRINSEFYLKKINNIEKKIKLDSLNFDEENEDYLVLRNTYAKDNDLLQNSANLNPYKYPLYPTWGHEYLNHWYEKMYNVDNCTIILEGDSITEGNNPLYSGVNDYSFDMRGKFIKKFMKIGGFPLEKLTLVNNGHGGRNTNEWVGNTDYANTNWINRYPNGFLDVAMSKNPDLLVIAWGMNDAGKDDYITLDTIEERLQLYEKNMREGLDRIRGNVPINGRPSYNKKLKDLSIIICNPTVCYNPATTRTNEMWFQHVRKINQKLCREYHCAFCDLTARTYDHKSDGSNYWGALERNGSHGWIHPNIYSHGQFTSLLQDLIYPICLWNVNID